MNSLGHWGWLVINYLFFGGLGAGAYLTSFAAEKGLFGKSSNLKRTGYFISGPCIVIATFLFSLNLGVSITGLFTMITNPRSVMTWGIFILIAFIVVGFICAFYKRENKEIPTLISWLGAVLALATVIYTGQLLSSLFAEPFWNTLLIPSLFVVSALAMGLASTSLLARFNGKATIKEGVRVNRIYMVLILVKLILLFILLFSSSSGMKGAVAARSAQTIVAGSLALPFWVLLIVIGLAFPLFYQISQSKEHKGNSSKYLGTLCELSVLIGGLTLRAIVIFSAVPIWDRLIK